MNLFQFMGEQPFLTAFLAVVIFGSLADMVKR